VTVGETSGDDIGLRLGLFGGTFDPVHTGHLEAADRVRRALDLDRMVMMVANQPWQKEGGRDLTPAEDRFAMVEAATSTWPGLEPSRREIDRGGATYTIDTVRDLEAELPGVHVYLVVGSDVVSGLATWKDEDELCRRVTLAVVGRPGAVRSLPPSGWEAVDVPTPRFDISSTELRHRLESGLPVDPWIPEPVIRCIAERGLYATRR
jgi:nicotinate-nucleotide adenylyltransferase